MSRKAITPSTASSLRGTPSGPRAPSGSPAHVRDRARIPGRPPRRSPAAGARPSSARPDAPRRAMPPPLRPGVLAREMRGPAGLISSILATCPVGLEHAVKLFAGGGRKLRLAVSTWWRQRDQRGDPIDGQGDRRCAIENDRRDVGVTAASCGRAGPDAGQGQDDAAQVGHAEQALGACGTRARARRRMTSDICPPAARKAAFRPEGQKSALVAGAVALSAIGCFSSSDSEAISSIAAARSSAPWACSDDADAAWREAELASSAAAAICLAAVAVWPAAARIASAPCRIARLAVPATPKWPSTSSSDL